MRRSKMKLMTLQMTRSLSRCPTLRMHDLLQGHGHGDDDAGSSGGAAASWSLLRGEKGEGLCRMKNREQCSCPAAPP